MAKDRRSSAINGRSTAEMDYKWSSRPLGEQGGYAALVGFQALSRPYMSRQLSLPAGGGGPLIDVDRAALGGECRLAERLAIGWVRVYRRQHLIGG